MSEKNWSMFSLISLVGMAVNYLIWKWFADVVSLVIGCAFFGFLLIGLWRLQRIQNNKSNKVGD
ncbi:MAG: hypothetical protein ACOWW1_07415 [archaeon]